MAVNKPWIDNYDEGVPVNLDYPNIPLYAFLQQAARKFPNRPCVISQQNSITYQEMDRLTDILAAALAAAGVHKGDRVGILAPNSPQFVLAYYGILKCGGVVVALNPLYKSRELAYQLSNAGVKIVIALDPYLPALDAALGETDVETVIVSSEEDAFQLKKFAASTLTGLPAPFQEGESRYRLVDLLRTFHGNARPEVDVSPADPAVFQYSGGTTGIPKGAIGTHSNLTANTLQFRAWLVGLEEGKETVLAAIPLFHVYGMVIAMSLGIYLGAQLVLIPDARKIQAILENIQNYKATLFPGVPNLYHAINNHPDVLAGKYELHSIKACISGSAPLLKEIKERFEELTGGKLLEGYGLSEAPTATHCNPMFGDNRTGSIGLPLPDVECAIVDLEDGSRHLAPHEAGELILRGPQVMAGYHNMPDETATTLREGWLYTGDIAWMDEDGYFYLVDRKKDVIKVGGFQVWPREVEEVISMHPNVAEVGVAGVPHPTRVEIVKAWVVPREGAVLSEDEIKAWCDEYLASFKVPWEVEFRQALPRTTVGKLLRRELVREHLDSQGS